MSFLFNGTCPIPLSVIEEKNREKPIFGKVHFQDLMVWISVGSAAYTTIAASYLILTHLFHYVRAREQRQIIRLAFYPLFYAIFSAASVYTYPDSIYLRPAGDLIEPISLAALFFLLLEYAEPNPDRREEYFSTLELKYQPKRFSKETRTVPGGSYRWFQGKWVALFCYFIATVVMKIVEIITQAAGRYCQSSFSLAFAHIWCTIISYIALPVGIIAVIQFYIRTKNEPQVKPNRPTQKIWAFKGVLLLNFLQDIVFTILVAARIFKGTETITLRDFQIGLPNTLLAVEQVVASTLFLWAFSVKPYKDRKHEKKMNPVWGLINACNILDLLYGAVYAVQLLSKGVGPYGNGSWNKFNGGYSKLKEPVTNIQMKRAHTVRSRSDRDSMMSTEEQAFKFEPIRTQEAPDVVVNGPPSYDNTSYGGYDAYRDDSQGRGRWQEERDDSYQGPYQESYQAPHHGPGQFEDDRDRLLSQTRSGGS